MSISLLLFSVSNPSSDENVAYTLIVDTRHILCVKYAKSDLIVLDRLRSYVKKFVLRGHFRFLVKNV